MDRRTWQATDLGARREWDTTESTPHTHQELSKHRICGFQLHLGCTYIAPSTCQCKCLTNNNLILLMFLWSLCAHIIPTLKKFVLKACFLGYSRRTSSLFAPREMSPDLGQRVPHVHACRLSLLLMVKPSKKLSRPVLGGAKQTVARSHPSAGSAPQRTPISQGSFLGHSCF